VGESVGDFVGKGVLESNPTSNVGVLVKALAAVGIPVVFVMRLGGIVSENEGRKDLGLDLRGMVAGVEGAKV